ncbi:MULTISPECIES: hypothetical protein [unclassified Sporosarcina]|uniref:hypothetical protein n=1 Tax=unclassified Sporosarcina TaxID=2647733 RepID=UPI00203BCE8E|nr:MULTISPECIES: hypothetical protein [unclassified Sporosarcina]GKV64090.1 hypothetical protein NCCP2331_02430 [Sporosarcina sp. NCCP-2331]GLB54445.1 hypothetical protein NCCP2378_02300 [Sporosarcina sp. NCCP-2378]
MKRLFMIIPIVSILLLSACSDSNKDEKELENQVAAEEVEKEEERNAEEEKQLLEDQAAKEAKEKEERKKKDREEMGKEILDNLIIEETSCEAVRNFIQVNGYVKNESIYGLMSIKVRVEYLDSSQNVVDTDYTFAVAPGEVLLPNERKSFSLMSPVNDSISNCSYYVYDVDY